MKAFNPRETQMHYKTIVLELLKEHRETYNELRRKRAVLPTMEQLARDLASSHEKWKTHLSQTKPGSHPSQIASEALELALKDLEDIFHHGTAQKEDEPPSPGTHSRRPRE
jgi:hypothetical protein